MCSSCVIPVNLLHCVRGDAVRTGGVLTGATTHAVLAQGLGHMLLCTYCISLDALAW